VTMANPTVRRGPRPFTLGLPKQSAQRALNLPSAVRLPREGKMEDSDTFSPSGVVELRGILISISNRFYTNGWGWAQLQTDTTVVKVTGALEGHVQGTSVIVKGKYKTTQYGTEVECSSIMVDSVSGELSVLQAWARKRCKEHEVAVMQAVRQVSAPDRWALLVDMHSLQARGVEETASIDIAVAAELYLQSIKMQRELMELGFTDNEAEKIFGRYEEAAMKKIEEDPYGVVLERVLPFTRVDSVVSSRFDRNDSRRLQAAMVHALVGLLRDGHTAGNRFAVQKHAADGAGVYVDAIVRTKLPYQIMERGDFLQLRTISKQEGTIAKWIHAAADLENKS
jgi:hypothetical protein